MLIELNIESNPNVNETEDRPFMGKGAPIPLTKTLYYSDFPGIEPVEVHITGWHKGVAIPAYALLVEDSGDGDAWLIYGGNEGIRLRFAHDFSIDTPFSLHEKKEWGEKYLYYHAKLYDKVVAPYINPVKS